MPYRCSRAHSNLAAAGVITGADRTNREYVGDDIEIAESVSKEMGRLLYDPQTAGGMLISIVAESAKDIACSVCRRTILKLES